MATKGGRSRVTTILITIFVLLVIALVIYWLVTGGPARAWLAGKNYSNPIAVIFGGGTTTGTYIQLPWQPAPVRGPDVSGYVAVADQQQQEANAQDKNPNTAPSQRSQYGEPSPYQGAVTIVGNNATAQDPAQEFIAIQASASNSAPINVSGWILQSAVSGSYGPIPQAAPVFVRGVVNPLQPVALSPGDSAIVATGISPVGVSLQETECTGYLSQTQQFFPALNGSCPAPQDELPQTAQNLRVYGAACFDYLARMPECYFPGAALPQTLSSNCRMLLSTAFSYNGCVEAHRGDANFALPSWRLFLGENRALWNSAHDIIRLLDAQGRVVDVLSY